MPVSARMLWYCMCPERALRIRSLSNFWTEESGSKSIRWSIGSDCGHVQTELHALANSQSGVPCQHHSWTFGPRPARAAILKILIALHRSIVRCWMEHEPRAITRFLLEENANVGDIQRKLQEQFTDDVCSIRSVKRWSQFIRQGEKTSTTIRGRVVRRPTLSTPKSC
jgi:hypothetical protein